MTPSQRNLAERVQTAFDRCKEFPETGLAEGGRFQLRPDAFMALIELRNLCPDILAALHQPRSTTGAAHCPNCADRRKG